VRSIEARDDDAVGVDLAAHWPATVPTSASHPPFTATSAAAACGAGAVDDQSSPSDHQVVA